MKKHNNINHDADSRISTLRESYESRIKSLHDKIINIEHAIDNDELINTMRSDPNTKSFVAPRIKEIIEEGIIEEKEAVIQNYISLLSCSKDEIQSLKEQISQQCQVQETNEKQFEVKIKDMHKAIDKEKKENTAANKKIEELNSEIEQLNQQYHNELQESENNTEQEKNKLLHKYEELRSELGLLKEKSGKSDLLIKAIQKEYEEKTKQLTESNKSAIKLQLAINELNNEKENIDSELQSSKQKEADINSLYSDLSSKYKEEQLKAKQAETTITTIKAEKDEIIEKFNIYSKELQNANKVAIEIAVQELKEKITKNKEKYDTLNKELQTKNEEISNIKNLLTEQQITHDKEISDYNNKIQIIKCEQENKYSQVESEALHKIAEEQSKCEAKIKQVQEKLYRETEDRCKQTETTYKEQIAKAQADCERNANECKLHIEAMQKTCIPLEEHQNILEKEATKLKEKFKEEMKSMRDEYERTLNSRISTLEIQRNKEQEILKISNESSLKTMQCSMDEIKTKYSDVYLQLQEELRIKVVAGQTIKELKEQTEEYEKALDAVKENEANIIKDKAMLERNYSSIETQYKQAKEAIASMHEKMNELNIFNEQSQEEKHQLSNSVSHIKGETEDAIAKYNACQAQNTQLTEQLQKLQMAFEMIEKEKKQMMAQYKRKVEESDNEVNQLQATMAIMRSKESTKYESELKAHDITKTKCKEIECQMRMLEQRNHDLSKEIASLKSKQSESRVQAQQIQKLRDQNNKLKHWCSNVKYSIYGQVQTIRQQYKSMVNQLKDVILSYSTEYSCTALKFISIHKNKEIELFMQYNKKIEIERFRIEHTSSLSKKEEKDKDRQIDDIIKTKNKEIQQLQNMLNEEQSKQLQNTKQIGAHKTSIIQYQSNITTLQSEYDLNKLALKQAQQHIDNLKLEIKEILAKHTVDIENAIASTKKSAIKTKKSQWNSIIEEIKHLSNATQASYKELLEDVQLLHSGHKQTIEQVCIEQEITAARYEQLIKQEKTRMEEFQSQNHEIVEEVSMINDVKNKMESQIRSINENLIMETEKGKIIQKNAKGEIEILKEKIEEQSNIIEEKESMIGKIKEEQGKATDTIKQLNKKLIATEESANREIEQLRTESNKKAKEIDSLHEILSRSYATLNSSTDKLKQASIINYQTQALTKKIRDSVPKKKPLIEKAQFTTDDSKY